MQSQKTLKLAYIISFMVLILSGAIIFSAGIKLIVLDKIYSINLQQILIMFILIFIPGVLVWSKRKVRQLREIESLEKRLEEYEKIELIRLVVYGSLGILTLIVQLLSALKGLYMLFLVIICLFMFIWPTKSRLEQETGYLNVDSSSEEKEVAGESEEEKEDEEDEGNGI